MKYTYRLLRASWGIVIFLDIKELIGYDPNSSDIIIENGISLRIDKSIIYLRDKIEFYFLMGLKGIAQYIPKKMESDQICFYLKSIDFTDFDFQEEGLYCAVQEWVAKYYDIEIPPVKVEYDKGLNKYVFDFKIDKQ
jgi:hypothetical protein